ncbi:MAG: glycoside hydrolase family 3 C-terminal domain-containing protein [Calditrichaceae bacterium]|nr:glycoside hydrolase family 3 C-terminal domain-containing protein [Calditrichaceae bacterium]
MIQYFRFYTIITVIFCFLNISSAQTDRAIEDKITTLLAKMTIEEKIGQMTQFSAPVDSFIDLIRAGLVGSILNLTGAERVNAIQKIAVEESRLGIPLINGRDVIHGFRTIFPIPLGETATWSPDLVKEAARIAAREASASGVHWTFAPMVDIARDARWGRISEGAGEDTYMGKIMAAARVKGFQGEKLSDPETIAACVKHFAAYGAAEAGKDYNTVDISERTLREVYLPPFKAGIDAGAATLMCSFNEISGVPSSGNKFLLTDILRSEWAFKGFVVSDWQSVTEMINHGNVADTLEAALLAAEAGVDMEMVSGSYNKFLVQAVKNGQFPEEKINEMVRRILRVKFQLGLFDNPYTDSNREKTELLSDQNRRFAREISAKAIVLLKNENEILPLKKNLKSIALIGPLADNQLDPLGCWFCNGRADELVSVLQGFKNKIVYGTKINYVKGCEIKGEEEPDLQEAVKAAMNADVAVCVVGESFDMSGEAGSRARLGLPGRQLDLIKTVYETGVPVVVVLMNGRPLAIPWIAENIPAILETWHLGTECGNAIADVIFGDVNPGGKLPASFPRAVGQEPLYYNHKNTGRPPVQKTRFITRYYDMPVEPLFPFGYGLSYTTFEFSDLQISKPEIKIGEELKVGVVVKNTGMVKGDEVVQLYIRDLKGSVTRPVKELRGFKRITLEPGESKKIDFTVGKNELSFYDINLNYVVEPGEFHIWIGPNSTEGLHGRFQVVKGQ